MNTEVPPLELPQFIFSWIDYTVFAVLLSLSVSIGIYFGYFTKQNSTDEYLLGGKNMNSIPVAISLVASFISGVTILGVPADVYKFGSNYIWGCLCVPIACLLTGYVYLPVFFKLQFTTLYEYLNVRFDKKCQILASFLFTLNMLIYNPIVIYVPALALSQASGLNLHYITPALCIICIFYTTIGGLKAVVWTDTLQFFGIIGSCLAIIFIGIKETGGLTAVWNINEEGQRLDLLNFEFNPTIRDGVWAYLLGGTFYWSSGIVSNQSILQKFLTVPSLTIARRVLAMYCFGVVILIGLSVLTGNILYAKYFNCDPFLSNRIQRHDQILPYFVMDIGGSIPGFPGIFFGGIFSAALSSLSASLNAVSGTLYQDFILHFMPLNTTQKTASNILKLLVVIVGTICILLVFVIEQMGGILALIVALQGLVIGPILGLFTLGVLFPMANSKGAFYGGILGIVTTVWIVFNNKWYEMHGGLPNVAKPVSIDGCDFIVNMTEPLIRTVQDLPFVLYRISFWYNCFIGIFLVVTLGLIISLFTRDKDTSVHPDLLSPMIHSMLSKKDQDHLELSQTLSLIRNREEENK